MNNNVDDLKYIRSTMERSTKFLSLSGMSGVISGLVALLGATAAYFIIYKGYTFSGSMLNDMIILSLVVLVLAVSSGLYFSYLKAKKSNSRLWTPVTIQILKDAGIPLATGGVFCLLLMYHHFSYMISSAMLIFYGLSLINAGSRIYNDIRIMGLCQIIIGLIAGFFTVYGLLFWAFGFGVIHIIYGIVIYKKYDSKGDKEG